ncbi:MAG: glycosyltransferase [Terrisporobacter sp.]|uniref:glycosyltransferase n=1 Tax=Terrisporobacter sp. TaxID=1965305 RepID=UPI002FCBAE94
MYKKQKPIISIIVPVFNTSTYLNQCLESIVNQSFQNFEVICIDDGSTDNSFEILKEFEMNHDNFKAISQKNKGVAFTRNAALNLAQGEYIAFVDSDDYIKPNYLERLYKESITNNADVVICNHYRYFESSRLSLPIIYKKSKGIYNSKDILQGLIPDNLIHSYLWNKLWKKELFNNVSFPIMKFEDIAIMCDLIYNSKKIAVINDALYYYRIRKTSIVRSYSINTQNDYIKAYGYIRLFLENNNIYRPYKFYFKLLSIKVMLVMFFVNIFLYNEYKNCIRVMKNISSCFNFIKECNLNYFNYTKSDLEELNILQPSQIIHNKYNEERTQSK